MRKTPARITPGTTEADGRCASRRRTDEGAGKWPTTEERTTDAPQIGRQAHAAHEGSAPGRATAASLTAAALAAKLPEAFYQQPVLALARSCIGKVLVTSMPDGVAAGRIVECEAYRGPLDLAAHSARGRRTRRTEVMYGPPGRAYVFLLYGMHWAFNIVAAPEGDPHAVLVRAVEPVDNAELMSRRRSVPASAPRLTNGPGKVCRALGITRALYGADLRGDVVYLTDGAAGPIGRSPRINVEYAGRWRTMPWRFYERDNRYVSVPPRA